MVEEVKNVHREPHPFVGTTHLNGFVGRTIAFVGRIESVSDNELLITQGNDDNTKVIRYKNELGL